MRLVPMAWEPITTTTTATALPTYLEIEIRQHCREIGNGGGDVDDHRMTFRFCFFFNAYDIGFYGF